MTEASAVSTVGGKVAAVKRELLALIDGLEEGEALPAERTLAEDLHVARMTLRRAMDDLVYEGIVVRRRGHGVFVRSPKVAGRLAVTSFTEDMERCGLTPTTEVLGFRRGRASRGMARVLRVPVDDPAYYFTRLRLADGTPIAVERSVYVAAAVPDLDTGDLTGSIYRMLRQKYGIKVTGAVLNLEAVLPDPESARLLAIGRSQPCIQARAIGFNDNDRVIDVTDTVYRGDRYQLGIAAMKRAV